MGLRLLEPLKRRYRDAGVWQDDPLYRLVDRRADEAPDRLAVADQERSLTYEQFVTASRRLATWLASLDLPPGSAVACQAPSSALLPVVHFGCDRADLTFVPLSDSFRERELRHLLGTSRAAVAFVPAGGGDRDRLSMVQGMRDELPDLQVLGAFSGTADVSLESLIADGPAEDIALNTDADGPRHSMITSGTTELSRISLWSDNNLWFFMSEYRDCVDLRPGDVALGVAPANGGSTGYVFPVLAPLLFGASSVLLQRWDVEAGIALMGEVAATVATAIPTQMVQMLAHPEAFAEAAQNLRAFNNGGAPLPPDAARQVEELGGCRISTSYGASDGGVPTMTRIADPAEKRHHTVGRPLPETDLRLVDEGMSDVDRGEIGEVMWRNPTKSFGYLNDDERTAAAYWEDGWYRSGDLGMVDSEGYLHIVGRRKDMILRGGRNISPVEIERLLLTSPEVVEAVVVGVPDEVYGERVCACIIPVEGASPTMDDVCTFLLDAGLERFKLPERVELFDSFPGNVGGKVDKKQVLVAIADRSAQPSAP